MKDKIRNFMNGRYGTDELNRFLLIIALLLCIIAAIVQNTIVSLLAMLLIAYVIYRMLSKNFDARIAENRKFLPIIGKAAPYVIFVKAVVKNHGKNKIILCPSCKKVLRVPKGKGAITLKCPCGNVIKAKS